MGFIFPGTPCIVFGMHDAYKICYLYRGLEVWEEKQKKADQFQNPNRTMSGCYEVLLDVCISGRIFVCSLAYKSHTFILTTR